MRSQRKQRACREWLFLILCAVAAGIGLNALVSLLQIDRISETYMQVRQKQYAVSVWEGILRYALWAPLMEEAVFRGIAFRGLTRWFSWQTSMIISAVLFAVYHGNLIQGMYALVMGLLIAYLYHVFQNFAAPVVFHGAANLAVFLLSYSPGTIPDVALAAVGVLCCSLAGVIVCWFVRTEILARHDFTDTVP